MSLVGKEDLFHLGKEGVYTLAFLPFAMFTFLCWFGRESITTVVVCRGLEQMEVSLIVFHKGCTLPELLDLNRGKTTLSSPFLRPDVSSGFHEMYPSASC